MAFYKLTVGNLQFDKVLEFVLLLELLELWDVKTRDTQIKYNIPDLVITKDGFTLKQLEYDFQHNKQELKDEVSKILKDSEVMYSLTEEFPLYIMLFNTRKRGVKQFYTWMQGFNYFKKNKPVQSSYEDVDSHELFMMDSDYIEALIQYSPEMVLDTHFYQVGGHPTIILGLESKLSNKQLKKLERLIPTVSFDEPMVFNYEDGEFSAQLEYFGL